MFNTNGGYSLSDIAAVTDGNNRNGDFGWGNGTWWIILLFFFAWGGFGGNGWGGFGGRNQSALTRGELDFSNLDSSIRGVQKGLCDGFYAMNTGMLNGFGNLQNTIMNGFNNVDNAVCTLGYQNQQGLNAMNLANVQNTYAIQNQLANGFTDVTSQLANCCCENRAAIADIKYTMATDTCAVKNTIQTSARDIVDNQNANTRSILDFLVNDKIQTLQAENQDLRLKASQAAQNNYLVETLRPAPVPAFPVCAPYQFAGCGYGVCNSFAG